MKEYTDVGCLNLLDAVFKNCLSKTKKKKDITIRQNFVDNSHLFKLYCLAEGRDYEVARRFVTLKNHKNCIDYNLV